MDFFIQKTIKICLSARGCHLTLLEYKGPFALFLSPRGPTLLGSSHHPAWSSSANIGRHSSQCQYFCAARARGAGCGEQRHHFALWRQNLLPGSLAVGIWVTDLGILEGPFPVLSYLPSPSPHPQPRKKAPDVFCVASPGWPPGPSLSGASPTLALTPQCGLDVATVPYKPQCAAGAGAGLGWVERKGA